MSFTNTDIYDITSSINELTKKFADSEDETTLALGMYGAITSLESKKIQTAVMMASELSNEVMPTRAKIDKNIITHAIMQNITDINAVPSAMTVLIGIKETDLDTWMDDNDTFYVDKTCSINITDNTTDESYEFHLDYDIILTRSVNADNIVYAAIYDMDRINPISDIDNPYLKQPYRLNLNGVPYVFIQCRIHQVALQNTYSQLVSSNIIDNKTLTFTFENQLADFDVKVTENGVTTYLTPVFEGSGIDSDIEYYCSYIYVNSNIVRVKFNRESYMPSLNAEIEITVKTTMGASAIFEFSDNITVNLKSDTYGYENINGILIPNTKSSGGVDRKSVSELQKILPKEILSRGLISSNTDLENYFNLINTDTNRLKLYPKVDNQVSRIYYAYLLVKDDNDNVIPTNTISINVSVDDLVLENNKYILPAGTMIRYSADDRMGHVITDAMGVSEDEYTYVTLYSTLVSPNPLYTAFFMTIVNEDPYLTFEYVNQSSKVQFICENIHLERRLMTDNKKYEITFTTKQNVKSDIQMLVFDEEDVEVVENNLRAYMIFYNGDAAYRYIEIPMDGYNYDDYTFDWKLNLYTDNTFDDTNRLKILNLFVAGTTSRTYGYMAASTTARIYLLGKFDEDYGRENLDTIIPGLEGWSVSNIYEVYDGINFFTDYSGITNVHIDAHDIQQDGVDSYTMDGIPVMGYYYLYDENNIFNFVEQMRYKKMYIDNARSVLENSFEIDFKLFNTYGPSITYTIDEENTTSIGRIDIGMYFELALKSSSDIYTKKNIETYIKDYIEDLNDIGDLHINNLLSDVREAYKSTITYFDFLGFNGFDGKELHMYQIDIDDLDDRYAPPEFINIRNIVDEDGNMTYDINITTISKKTS